MEAKEIRTEILRVLKEKAGENVKVEDICVIVATRILKRSVKLFENRELITKLMVGGVLAGLISEGKVKITVAWNVHLDSYLDTFPVVSYLTEHGD